ncbi:DUF4395 family protein [Janibacter limosus]|uniref:DUF4395 family protein n=1 Tax=Janibacter limosus TaxID=53458 RepID=UPI0035E19AAC|nr:DUF4395 family protein [Janibacter limosus]
MGVAFSTAAAVLALGFGLHTAAGIVLGVLVLFATLEAALGFCAGCFAFGHLMRLGVIPEETCEACADISLRRPRSPPPDPGHVSLLAGTTCTCATASDEIPMFPGSGRGVASEVHVVPAGNTRSGRRAGR